MKKLVSFLLVAFLAISLASCGGKDKKEEPKDSSKKIEEQNDKKEEDKKEENKKEEDKKDKDDKKDVKKAEGVPFEGKSGSEMTGTVKIESKWISFEKPLIVESTFDSNVTKVKDKYYIISDGKLKEYQQKGDKVSYIKDIDLPKGYKTITSDDNGIVYVSSFARALIGFKDGEQIFKFDDCDDNLAVHSSGKWGMLYNGLGEIKKVTFNDGNVELKDIENIEGLEELSDVFIGKENIFITGSLKKGEDKFQVVGVYDFDLKLKHMLGSLKDGFDADKIGSLSGMTDTKNGFLAFDSNFRKIIFWKKDGNVIGSIKASDLFGTNYPWITNLDVLEDESILIGMTQDREDKSAKEYLLYTIKGF